MLMRTLDLVKQQLGIRTDARDEYISAIIDGVKKELIDIQGLNLDEENFNHLMFIVDYSAWRYQSAGQDMGMPERLHWRLRNLMVGGKNGEI